MSSSVILIAAEIIKRPTGFVLFLFFVLNLSLIPGLQAEQTEEKSQVIESSIPELIYSLTTFTTRKPGKRFPLLLALHGMGQTSRQYLQLWKEEADRREVMILAPTLNWDRRDDLMYLERFCKLIDELTEHYPIDKEKIFLAGVSSGALVSRWLLLDQPKRWKAAVFIASPDFEKWMNRVDVKEFPPILYVHGAKDEQFKIEDTIESVELLKKKGVQTKLIRYPEAGHEHRPEWNREIFNWLEETYSAIR